jgi:sulfite reductase (NADPH) flavoprotein alpha-component
VNLTSDPLRLFAAAMALLAYAGLCLAMFGTRMRKERALGAVAAEQGTGWVVAFASQTGTAEELAARTVAALRVAGLTAHACSLSTLSTEQLAAAERALFIVSTYGEGDAPDNAALFAGRAMHQGANLEHLHFALMALGDSAYANFCGFGRTLDHWLREQGAHPLFDRIEVDRHDAAAIERWQQQLSHLAGTSDAPDWSGPPFADWRLAARRMLNPGSAGGPVYHLELEPVDSALPDWQAGDLAQVLAPGDPRRPREYSIASIAGDGRIHLLLRLHRDANGRVGLASGWLAQQLAVGATLAMRVRRHRRFQLGENTGRPLILIGNGTGMAGLRAHLKARAASDTAPNWLIFGERNRAADFYYREEIEAWLESGLLTRADLVFSRDGGRHRYVQDRLREAGDLLNDWVGKGAAIYVCGSLQGMAGAVDEVLGELLGSAKLQQLNADGRYRRDVY